MSVADLLDEATAARLEGGASERQLKVGQLEPGHVGVLRVDVRTVHAVKTFQRKNGGEGSLRRVTLGDPTGEVDLVLWGDETQQAVSGPFTAGQHLILRGATVKEGFRGGIEVQLGGAVVEPLDAPPEELTLEGVFDSIGETKVSGAPPQLRFHAELTLATSGGISHVILWDECIKAIREVLPGRTVRIEGVTLHPALEGWFVADGARITHR